MTDTKALVEAEIYDPVQQLRDVFDSFPAMYRRLQEEVKMKAGTLLILPGNKPATVVYNGLDGVGIKWGHHAVTEEEVAGNGLFSPPPEGYKWFPDAMLRNPYPSADLPCVGTDYERADGGEDD